MGLGIAYAGSSREDLLDLLAPTLTDEASSPELVGAASTAIGLGFVGSANGEVSSELLQANSWLMLKNCARVCSGCKIMISLSSDLRRQALLSRTEEQLKDPHVRFIMLGLALTFLGRQDAAEPTLEGLKVGPLANSREGAWDRTRERLYAAQPSSRQVLAEPYGRYASTLLTAAAYAGTGNVLKIQSMLHACSEHFSAEKNEDDTHQGVATLAIALIGTAQLHLRVQGGASGPHTNHVCAVRHCAAMGEDVGAEMATRTFGHLLQYGEPVIRRAVPLALALLYPSNPAMTGT